MFIVPSRARFQIGCRRGRQRSGCVKSDQKRKQEQRWVLKGVMYEYSRVESRHKGKFRVGLTLSPWKGICDVVKWRTPAMSVRHVD